MAEKAKSRKRRQPAPPQPEPAGRELIVIASEAAADTTAPPGAELALSPLLQVLNEAGATIQPLFGASEGRVQWMLDLLRGEATAPPPALTQYYRVEAPDEALDTLAAALNTLDMVEAAYVKPAAEVPQRMNDMAPSPAEAPFLTPDFTARQLYLEAAPGGVDARYAWSLAGGGGAGVKIIDIEGEWRFSHEDLLQNQGGVAGGVQPNSLPWRNHGTAVVGEFGADRNGIGVTGICPDANIRAISIFGGLGSAAAIRQAADMLGPGDLILIELHRPGPRFNFQSRDDQAGYISVEWWPDDYDAIRYAVARDVIVVEAAGNGGQDLDDAIYDAAPLGFPASWTNPFNRSNRDSGAIMVGAGAPPPGTHGRDNGPDRSRLDFSNYGTVIDAQGWGREVTTCGYGDLQGGGNEDLWYTDQFSGTSSAAPIVVGVLSALQGVARAHGQAALTPERARSLLRSTGSPQQSGPAGPATQRIGNRPDLRVLIGEVLEIPPASSGTRFAGPVPAKGTRRWASEGWPADWQVVWNVVPLTPRSGLQPQISWELHVQRTLPALVTYWLTVHNISNQPVDVEGRYTVVARG